MLSYLFKKLSRTKKYTRNILTRHIIMKNNPFFSTTNFEKNEQLSLFS